MRSLSHSHHVIPSPCYEILIEVRASTVEIDTGDTITSYYEQAENCGEEQGAVERHDPN